MMRRAASSAMVSLAIAADGCGSGLARPSALKSHTPAAASTWRVASPEYLLECDLPCRVDPTQSKARFYVCSNSKLERISSNF